jgi:hypothetical protein
MTVFAAMVVLADLQISVELLVNKYLDINLPPLAAGFTLSHAKCKCIEAHDATVG